MRTPIHNIAPGRGPARAQVNDEVSVACRQIAQAIRNAVAPSLDEIGNMITDEYQRCQGLRTNGSAGLRKPLVLPADGEGMGGARVMANGRIDRGYIAPPGDEDDVGDIMPARNSKFTPPAADARKPLALKADRGFIAPEGD